MQTTYDVIFFSNKLDFTDKIIDDEFENLRCVKKILV